MSRSTRVAVPGRRSPFRIRGYHPLWPDFPELNNKVKTLTDERNKLIEENAKYQTLSEENDVLREQLGFLTRNKNRYVVGNVISRGDINNSANTAETIYINKGSQDGIYAGLGSVS